MHHYFRFPTGRNTLVDRLMRAPAIHRGEWQAMDVSRSKAHVTHELEDVCVYVPYVPSTTHLRDGMQRLAQLIRPDLPWAEDHFLERVSGEPMNPAPSAARWPYAVRNNADHTRCPTCDSRDPRTHPAVGGGGEVTSLCPDNFHSGTTGVYDHTYPERFWPKLANVTDEPYGLYGIPTPECNAGIRFNYGDLNDVVQLLARNPLTRQAYLPVWFPEDTGAVSGQRVPCTLGYHFMIDRNDQLSCRYYMRSCDVYRHMTNDIYLACRLMQWVSQQVTKVWDDEATGIRRASRSIHPGRMTMYIASLHMFVGDKSKVSEWVAGTDRWEDTDELFSGV